MYLVDGEISLGFSVEVNSYDYGVETKEQIKQMVEDIINECLILDKLKIKLTNGIMNIDTYNVVAKSRDVIKIDEEGYPEEKEMSSNRCELLDDM